jgi:hypothetical protein
MKKLFILMLIASSCKKEIYPEQSTVPIEQQTQLVTQAGVRIPDQIGFTVPGLYPEGIAFDKFNNRFLVSSFGKGTIGTVSFIGDYTPFIRDDDLKSTLGLHIDEARKRVVVAVTDGLFGDVAKVGVYDLQTGSRIWLIDLAPLWPEAIHLADDLAIDPEGNIYITDAKSPVIYKVDINGRASVFFENDLFAKPPGFPFYWVGFNGIVYNNNGFLIVAFYAAGKLIKIPVNDPINFSEVQLDVPITSADGLLLSQNGRELIVVDNKYLTYPPVIVRMVSNDKWVSAQRIESFPTGFTSPTTATSDGRNVFVLYTYLFDIFFGTPNTNTKFLIQKMPFENTKAF